MALLLVMLHPTFSNENDISIKVTTDKKNYTQLDTVIFALTISIPKDYHLYSNPLGPGVGKPLSLKFYNSDQIKVLETKKEKPIKFIPKGMETDWTWAWENETHIFVKAVILKEINNDASIKANISGLICKTDCLPVSKDQVLSATIGIAKDYKESFNSKKVLDIYSISESIPFTLESEDVSKKALSAPLISMNFETPKDEYIPQWSFTPREAGKKNYNILLAIVLAFIAGIILNFMPCVLPVLGIKILSFSKGREGSKKTAIFHSLSFLCRNDFSISNSCNFCGICWYELGRTVSKSYFHCSISLYDVSFWLRNV